MTVAWSTVIRRLGMLVGLMGAGVVGCGGDVAPDHDEPYGEYSQEATLSACSKSAILAATPPERLAILTRGFDWVDRGVMYSQTPQRAEGGYRTDCSGFVSMCWGLGAPGETTSSFTGGAWDSGRTHRITWADLQPGDALNNPGHHVVLFGGWLDEAHTRFCTLEEYNWGHPAGIIHHSVYDTSHGQPFHDGYIPMRFNADPPGAAGAGTTTPSDTGAGSGSTGTADAGTSTGTPTDAGSSGGSAAGPTCFSHTVGHAMQSMACLQSRFDHVWYQCVNGSWRAGNGAYGACSSSTPLAPAMTAATCYSATLGRSVPELTCLQSRLDQQWYQCTDTGWVVGPAIASGHTGTLGPCSASYPLH